MTLKASLWEGGGPKGRRERACDLAADKGDVSPSVAFGDSSLAEGAFKKGINATAFPKW